MMLAKHQGTGSNTKEYP